MRRTTLHDTLRQRASELNINFVDRRVEKIVQSSSSVEAAGIRSRYLIGADGLHSTVRSQLGLETARKHRKHQRYGIRQHFEVKPWSDLVEVYWLPNAEVYVTPVDNQTVGDAAGYVDAITGEGMRVGFAEAQAAVRAVVDDSPKAYEVDWQRITRSYRLLAGGLLWVSSNRAIRPMIVPAAQILPSVFRRLVNTLS